MHQLPEIKTETLYQPVEFIEVKAGIYFRSIILKRGEVVPQHTHPVGHATYVGMGLVRLWVNGVWVQDIPGGHAVEIEGGKEHLFQALEESRLTCIWREDVAEQMLKGE